MSTNLNVDGRKKRRPQSGNAAWRAVMVLHQIKPNYANRMQCTAIAKQTSKQCRLTAMRGVTICLWHGGRREQARQQTKDAIANGKGKQAGRAKAAKFKRAAYWYIGNKPASKAGS